MNIKAFQRTLDKLAPLNASVIRRWGSSMSTEQPEDDWDTVVETRDPRSTGSKLDAFGWGLLRWWGILFRTVFISLVGISGYLLQQLLPLIAFHKAEKFMLELRLRSLCSGK